MAIGSNTYNNNFNIDIKIDGDKNIGSIEQALVNSDKEIQRLNKALASAENTIASMAAELDAVNRKSGFADLTRQVETFQQRANEAANEFYSFLQAAKLIDSDEVGFWRFEDLYNSIAQGAKTAQQAIVQVKNEYAHLFEENYSDLVELLIHRWFNLSTRH